VIEALRESADASLENGRRGRGGLEEKRISAAWGQQGFEAEKLPQVCGVENSAKRGAEIGVLKRIRGHGKIRNRK
jgi:hypothetical protein